MYFPSLALALVRRNGQVNNRHLVRRNGQVNNRHLSLSFAYIDTVRYSGLLIDRYIELTEAHEKP